jgi:hypothetical protein
VNAGYTVCDDIVHSRHVRSIEAQFVVDHLAAEDSAQSLSSFGGFTHFFGPGYCGGVICPIK